VRQPSKGDDGGGWAEESERMGTWGIMKYFFTYRDNNYHHHHPGKERGKTRRQKGNKFLDSEKKLQKNI